MATRYAYHPGNVAHSNAIEVADTMPLAAESLGIELVALEGATTVSYTHLTLPTKLEV